MSDTEGAKDILTRIQALLALGARTEEGRRILAVKPEIAEIIRDPKALARVAVEAAGLPMEEFLEPLAERLVAGWDRWGAPSAARTPEGRWVGSFEGPGEAYAVEAESKREAYRKARKEWLRRLLVL